MMMDYFNYSTGYTIAIDDYPLVYKTSLNKNSILKME